MIRLTLNKGSTHYVVKLMTYSGAGKLTYCAFFDKSTNFDTEVDNI